MAAASRSRNPQPEMPSDQRWTSRAQARSTIRLERSQSLATDMPKKATRKVSIAKNVRMKEKSALGLVTAASFSVALLQYSM